MRILFIGLDYHQYTRAISAQLNALGHDVTYHDIFARTLYHKSLRLAPALQRAAYDRYHRDIMLGERGTPYDMVLFLQCHQVSDENLQLARDLFPNARFVLYNWDSVRTHDYISKLRFFDTAFTFDRQDAIDFKIEYLPLFGLTKFQDAPLRPDGEGSIYFVGNIVNPDRYLAIDGFRRYCKTHAIDFECFMAVRPAVIPSLLRTARPRGVSPVPISMKRFQEMLWRSKATFDYANHAQTGMTMRVIENLCARRKIVTTNLHVRDQWFYSPDRIMVVQRGEYDGVAEFLRTPLDQPTKSFEEFYIQSFARFLLGDQGHPLDGSQPKLLK
ncbi:MAG: hypothetical protein VX454_03265 [Pseudomonadota bacterium]|jgi:hypothetical protein|nr:hypothetical protein [Pseudomonadota bacterium]